MSPGGMLQKINQLENFLGNSHECQDCGKQFLAYSDGCPNCGNWARTKLIRNSDASEITDYETEGWIMFSEGEIIWVGVGDFSVWPNRKLE